MFFLYETVVGEKDKDYLSLLTDRQVKHLWLCVKTMWPVFVYGVWPPGDAEDLYKQCRKAKLDRAKLILSLSGRSDELSVSIVKVLVGRNIYRWRRQSDLRPRPGKLKQKHGRPRIYGPVSDPRIIVSISPNPYKMFNVSYHDYAKMQTGKTVDQCFQEGLTRRMYRRAIRAGWLVLEAPTKSLTWNEEEE